MMATGGDSNKDSLRESVLMNLRSVTQSRKGGVPLSSLDRDYKDLLGHSIPYRDLGYPSLEAFIKDIPSVIKLRYKDGQWVAEGVADSSTAHIDSLVKRQKTSLVKQKPRWSTKKSGNYSKNKTYSSQKYYSVHQTNKHSKFTPNVPKEHAETKIKVYKSQSPERPKFQKAPQRATNYELPPRFQKKIQEMNKEKTWEEVQRNESPTFRAPFREQPELSAQNFNIEPDNDIFIKSPRPLNPARAVIVKKDRLKELERATTSKEYIEIYADINSLEYSYSTKPCGQKRKNFISSLILDGKKYHSYPELSHTKEGAEELAAGIAVKTIKENQEHLATCHETTIRNAEDVTILINRIEEIVYEKPSGMFVNGIVSEYENKFNETLPENWLQLLQQSSIVEIEELDLPNGRVPDGVNHIVRRARQSSGSTTPSSVSDFERADLHENNLPKNNVRRDHLPVIPALQEPIGNEWAVFIVDVSKTIAARLVDYDEEYLEMMTEMKSFYVSESLPALEISESLLYAAYDADSDLFHRVLIQKIKENDKVECYYVDEGIFAEVSKSDLQELHSRFWKLPYQAIHMTLDSLDDIYNPNDLQILLNTILIALIKRCGTTVPDYFPADPAINKKIYSVELYNTSGKEDVNMNEIIKDKMLESLAPKLPKSGVSASGYYLSHIETTGEIFLRKLPLDSWLEVDLEKLSPEFEEASSRNVTAPFGKIFVAKYEDEVWYRAVLMHDSPSGDTEKVKVFFIDYGNSSTVSTKDISELEPFSEFLSYLEPQAIKCELFNALPTPDSDWTPEAVTKLNNLVNEEELLIRVISEGDETTLPKVNLYKRIYQNGDSFIISINDSIANMPELFKAPTFNMNSAPKSPSLKLSLKNDIRPPVPRTPSNYASNNHVEDSPSIPIMPPSPANDLKWVLTPDSIKSPDALEDHNLPPLKLPDVPNEGQFDVFVTMAASPHNFYVQPHKTIQQMYDLMEQMNQFYGCEENLIEMHKSLLKENGFYAVKHKDGNWYRAQLQTVLNFDTSMLVVIYVDYGDIVTVNLPQVQSLYTQFRHLPCQGIKASLSGVKPINKDWKTMQCVEFQNMVKEKRFVSIIQKKSVKENRNSPYLELQLTLIDVSDPYVDNYIHELLIKKGIAQPASSFLLRNNLCASCQLDSLSQCSSYFRQKIGFYVFQKTLNVAHVWKLYQEIISVCEEKKEF